MSLRANVLFYMTFVISLHAYGIVQTLHFINLWFLTNIIVDVLAMYFQVTKKFIHGMHMDLT